MGRGGLGIVAGETWHEDSPCSGWGQGQQLDQGWPGIPGIRLPQLTQGPGCISRQDRDPDLSEQSTMPAGTRQPKPARVSTDLRRAILWLGPRLCPGGRPSVPLRCPLQEN